MGANFRHFGAHAFKALLNQRFQRLAFGFAGNDKVIQRAIKSCQNFGGNGVQILLPAAITPGQRRISTGLISPSSLCILTQLAALTSCLPVFR
jgi:hypothetical protein